jgi:S1-C subfamily serine protease
VSKKTLKSVKTNLKNKLAKLRKLTAGLSPKQEALYVGLLAMTMFGAALAPSVHRIYLRQTVGSRVYMVRSSPKGGGGTGFVIKAPSGNNYLMTNDHVCAASKDGLTMVVMNDDGEWIPRQILHRSDKTDLCILEAMPGVEGLEVADSPSTGQAVTAVGHPGLMPLTLSSGEILGSKDLMVLEFITMDKDDPNCKKPKNSIVEVGVKPIFSRRDITFMPVYACVITVKNAFLTSAIIRPGSSGSPMVDWRGRVQGVMFAGDAFGWGAAVSLKDVKEMLKLY